ncbi:hypothetical protein BN949_02604 [Agrobacterium tumefaciens]|nr:hypothetical protein BN949_02604 [Agrobacterium tumefaciens]
MKGEEVSEDHKERLVVLFLLVVCVTILPPLFFGEARSVKDQVGGDSWRNFIFDFQTLIGGGAAMIAAWYTVRQMRISDMKSYDRHRELVELQLRPDTLRVERMLKPGLADLEACYEEIRGVRFNTLSKLLKDEPAVVAQVMEQLRLECAQAVRIMKRPQFEAASDLFDGDLAYQFGNTMTILNDLANASRRCGKFAGKAFQAIAGGDEAEIERTGKILANSFGRVFVTWEAILVPFADMNVCLTQMKRRYRIH